MPKRSQADVVNGDKENGGPRSLTRLLGLFDALARSPNGLTLAELNVTLESPKSSLLNLLRPLVNDGYLNHDGSRYLLGPAVFRLAANVMSVWNFSKVLHPYLEELANRCHETVYVGILDREQGVITYLQVIESAHSVRYSMPVGTSRPLYCTAAGRLLLAHADREWQEEYMRRTKMEPRTPQTITRKKELRAELENVLQKGYSVSVGELMRESAGIAAPIFGTDGKVVAALAIGAPSDRFEQERPLLQEALLDVATRASGMMRGSSPVLS
ncbi:IclR family transcriptional regulator [Aromatoleum petrolei]|uniref:Helix-turn-helix domain-containing protein n=1 Tax=Aromatoleum petrolei TaxID=76116 RepID=A0ABX1MKS3_9RHOO|nr:IclR family transcriptional regulator [Aromatoleum petrolei]NMF88568.1 helix-turn-helix domain-containing protein [Aromatoleum petrolei]QTQ34724.1 Transcriptional regulator, IclR family [Aromatoleum petrolei]